MTDQIKLYIGTAIATVAVLAIGVGILSHGNKSAQQAQTSPAEFLVREDSAKISSDTASVTMVEFGDYQCPACGSYHPVVKQILKDFAGKVNFVFRNFPLDVHKNSRPSAYAVEAAGLQGKFWEMHDKVFESQAAWNTLDNPMTVFDKYAKDLGLDIKKFDTDVNSSIILEKVKRDLVDGGALAVDATPTFYLNGEKLTNPGSLDDFETLIKAAILKAPLPSPTTAWHSHFDIKIYQGGSLIDLSQAKYQSEEGKELDENIHLHDGNGKVVHIHKQGETVGDLLKSLKLSFGATTKLYVNGKLSDKFADYAPADADRILISDAIGDVLTHQMTSVTNDACIYSLTCPERGKPPTESCVGGLGTGCKD